ncbi:MAG: AAA family ATPase [Verrucomicrobiota bacterium]
MKIVILGNSGSGKTTLAKRFSDQFGCAHLDLDDIRLGGRGSSPQPKLVLVVAIKPESEGEPGDGD